MTIPEEMMAVIQETARKAAREGAKEVIAEQTRKAAGRCDRRLRNTKLLLKNYRMFKKHCTGAVYTDETGDHDGKEEETALELLDMMLQRNNAITVESIRNSCRRTKIMVRHIDSMLALYETYCEQSKNEAHKRGYRIIKAMYIDDEAKSIEQLAALEGREHPSGHTETTMRPLKKSRRSCSALMPWTWSRPMSKSCHLHGMKNVVE